MTQTGWMSEEPEAAAPSMPVTARLLAGSRGSEPQPGAVLEQSLARSRAAEARQAREEAAGAFDADEYAAALVVRGYTPGMFSSLSMKLADTMAELADEEDKIERAERREQRTRQMHERGQIDVSGVIARMADTDDGDARRADQLRRRAESLRTQIAEVSQIMVPPQARAADMYEQGASRAARILADVAAQREDDDAAEAAGRAALARERGAFYGRRGRRPFASRGAAAEQAQCAECAELGATAEESFLIHNDPNPAGLSDEELAAYGEILLAEQNGGQEAGRGERRPVRFDGSGREIARAVSYR